MPKAKLHILYREKETADAGPPYDIDGVSDTVRVEARRWSGPSCNDVVVEHEVIVDGRQILSARECRNGYGCTDAEVQRHAIALFDCLLAGHPTLCSRRHPQRHPLLPPDQIRPVGSNPAPTQAGAPEPAQATAER